MHTSTSPTRHTPFCHSEGFLVESSILQSWLTYVAVLIQAKVAESRQKKPEMVHVILTGRNAHPTIVEAADTVTEMRQVKHA
ncbi:MAG: cob(I)yrinic acid a,c-diamide adenosyltransferase [Candidatus Sulfotelmatobacter sp.]